MLTRRQAFGRGFAAAAATSVWPALAAPAAHAADDGVNPRFAFAPVSADPIVDHRSADQSEAYLIHPTLLPLRHLTGRADLPAWILYAWHHDTGYDHFHAWTAP